MSLARSKLCHDSCIFVSAVLPGTAHAQNKASGNPLAGERTMKLSSPSFINGKSIPSQFSCKGTGVNPAFDIAGLPAGTKALALIVDDPDAPAGTFIHWVVYDIPVISRIEENSVPGKQGMNSSGKRGFTPPCPPSGTHRYYFRLYALNAATGLKEGASRANVESAMKGHTLGTAEYMGTFTITNYQ